MPIQIIGGTSGIVADVDTDKNLRVINRPPAFGSLGAYGLDALSGAMAAGLAAQSPVYSIRWADLTRFALIQNVYISMCSLGTAFTAGIGRFELMFARSFTANDSGGNSILPAGSMNKKRTNMGTTLFTDMRQSSTATLTAGTRTLDTTALKQVYFAIGSVVNTVYLVTNPFWSLQIDGNHPIILAQNEGLVIRATVPATGTWQFNVGLEWMEVGSY